MRNPGEPNACLSSPLATHTAWQVGKDLWENRVAALHQMGHMEPKKTLEIPACY